MSDITPPHGGQLDPGEWWACAYPERPVDSDWTAFDLRCPSCSIAASVASIHLHPDRGMDVRTDADPDGYVVVLAGSFGT